MRGRVCPLVWLSLVACLASCSEEPSRSPSLGGGGAGGTGTGTGVGGAGASGQGGTDPGVPVGAPAIYFLDVQSAQIGDFIVVRGRNFGASGTLTFGAATASDIISWANTRIVARVPAGASEPVTVQTALGTSNERSFATHAGQRYWVAPTGADTAAGTESQPFASLEHAKETAVPGDTVVVREGVYQEVESDVGVYLRASESGAAGLPITLRGYPGETVVIDGSVAQATTVYVEASHIVITGFEIRNSSGQNWASIGDHNRIVDCDVHDANVLNPSSSGSGVNVAHGSVGAEIVGNHIHHNGSSDLDHGMYVKGDQMRIAYNDVHDNFAYGIQMYNGPGELWHGAVVHSNRTYRNGRAGIIVSMGSTGTMLMNNLSYDNDMDGILVSIAPIADTSIVNNTVVGNARFQLRVSDGQGALVRNNIFSGPGDMFRLDATASGVDSDQNLWGADQADAFNLDSVGHDLVGFRTASGQEQSSLSGNPRFADAGAFDFHLLADSPALDAADVAHAPPSDMDLNARHGAAPDLGAFEYVPAN